MDCVSACVHACIQIFSFQFGDRPVLSSSHLAPCLRVMRMTVSALCGQRGYSWAGSFSCTKSSLQTTDSPKQKLQSSSSWARFGLQIFFFFFTGGGGRGRDFHHFHLNKLSIFNHGEFSHKNMDFWPLLENGTIWQSWPCVPRGGLRLE